MTKKRKGYTGIIFQVTLLFSVSVILTAIITYLSQHRISEENVHRRIEELAVECAEEVQEAFEEYPAYPWLISYWYEHADELDIEYDVDYSTGTKTAQKATQFSNAYPHIEMKYATEGNLASLPPADQKKYAEITYSWLLTRINQTKRVHHVDFLFCVITAEPFEDQFFLISGADKGAVRGTNYLEVYPLGTEVKVTPTQQEAMRNALSNESHLADAGEYLDYYRSFTSFENKQVLIGLTYKITSIMDQIQIQSGQGTLFATIYLVVLFVLSLMMIYDTVLKPLTSVQSSIRLYKETRDREAVRKNLSAIKTNNEIGELSNDVIEMTEAIDNYVERIETITAEKERIGAELSLAARIQANTLPNVFPPFPERHEFDIYASMDPAKEVGGDFYDFFMIDEDHLALVIADVSGKGIPAALFMMTSLMTIHNVTVAAPTSPAEILRIANEQICDHNPEEMFVSVWLGILEISTGKVIAANAGHEYPTLQKNGRFEIVKDKHGFVIGGYENVHYNDYELQLEPGDKLFVYTDGLPEATNAEGKMFGMNRIVDALNAKEQQTPKDVLVYMQEEVNAFVKEAEQFDDLTMLCMSYYGNTK